MTRKLKSTEIKTLRLELLKKQNHICPLCNQVIPEDDAALDHNHENGMVRGVLHLGCNGAEGRILKAFVRSGASKRTDIKDFLTNLLEYYRIHEQDPSGLLHNTHLTPDERKAKAAKRRKAKAKANSKKET